MIKRESKTQGAGIFLLLLCPVYHWKWFAVVVIDVIVSDLKVHVYSNDDFFDALVIWIFAFFVMQHLFSHLQPQ